MSPATIDRLRAPNKAQLNPDGTSTTRSRKNGQAQQLPIQTHIREIDKQPGQIAIDTLAHCGHTIKCPYTYTLTVADPLPGCAVNGSVTNKAVEWIAQALDEIAAQFPSPVDHLYSAHGSGFLNNPVTRWCAARNIRMTRSRPHHSNDNPFGEQEDGDIVRRSAFHCRYDTAVELGLLKEL